MPRIYRSKTVWGSPEGFVRHAHIERLEIDDSTSNIYLHPHHTNITTRGQTAVCAHEVRIADGFDARFRDKKRVKTEAEESSQVQTRQLCEFLYVGQRRALPSLPKHRLTGDIPAAAEVAGHRPTGIRTDREIV